MSRLPAVVSAVTAAFLGFCVHASAPAADDSPFALEQVADGVYLHRGAHASLDEPARGDSANIGFIVGERCVAVIDSGGSLATGRALAAAIARVAAKPVCYVINTHVHFDHVLGNPAFTAPGVEFVGHAALAESMTANREFFADAFGSELGGAAVIGPGLLVEDETTLDLGARTLVLSAVATAHTSSDLTVHDLSSNTLWTGDLLFRERMPVLDGSLKGWLGWMGTAMAHPYAHVIPGHGPVDNAWPAGAEAQLRYLNVLLAETRQAIAAGAFLDEAQASVAAAERSQWLLPERAHRLNISRAYRELEWE